MINNNAEQILLNNVESNAKDFAMLSKSKNLNSEISYDHSRTEVLCNSLISNLAKNFVDALDLGATNTHVVISAKRITVLHPDTDFTPVARHLSTMNHERIQGEFKDALFRTLSDHSSPEHDPKNPIRRNFFLATSAAEIEPLLKKVHPIRHTIAAIGLNLINKFNGKDKEVLRYDPDEYSL